MERFVVDPKNPSTVYALAGCDGFDGCAATPPSFKSTDGGTSWASWDLPVDTAYLTIDSEGTIYLVTVTGLFKSADSGATWSVVTNSGLTSGISVLAVDPRHPNHFFAGTYGGGVFEITLVEE